MVSVGQQFANGLEAGASMGVAGSLFRLKAVLDAPIAPRCG